MEAFFDDSGIDTGERRYFVAGYMMSARRWLAFNREWAYVLAAKPAIRFFHMVEAAALSDEFAGMDEGQRDRKVHALSKVINKYRPLSFDLSISRKDFDEVWKCRLKWPVDHHFFPCLLGVMKGLAVYQLERGAKEPINIVFDQVPGFESTIRDVYTDFKETAPLDHQAMWARPPAFEDDKEFLPLQAADLLAWHIRRNADPRNVGENRPALRLAKHRDHNSYILPREKMQEMADSIASIEGYELMTDRNVRNLRKRVRQERLRNEGLPLAGGGDSADEPDQS